MFPLRRSCLSTRKYRLAIPSGLPPLSLTIPVPSTPGIEEFGEKEWIGYLCRYHPGAGGESAEIDGKPWYSASGPRAQKHAEWLRLRGRKFWDPYMREEYSVECVCRFYEYVGQQCVGERPMFEQLSFADLIKATKLAEAE
jgi:hypothetical protein